MKENYYSVNSKNSFFKKSQKLDCAKFISESIDLNTLIDKTVYAIPDKNIVFINYPVFKYYANPENYSQIIDHIINVFKYVIQYFGSYDVYINLSSFFLQLLEANFFQNSIRKFVSIEIGNLSWLSCLEELESLIKKSYGETLE